MGGVTIAELFDGFPELMKIIFVFVVVYKILVWG